MQLQLPDPGPDALMASRSLQTLIANDIRHHSGWIPFSRFMELALYCPVYGYYEQEQDIIGRRGDFYTSVSVGSLFGELLAWQFADWLDYVYLHSLGWRSLGTRIEYNGDDDWNFTEEEFAAQRKRFLELIADRVLPGFQGPLYIPPILGVKGT